MKEIEVTQEAIDAFCSYIDKREEENAFVRSDEYLEWLSSFTKVHDSFSDETWLYDRDSISEADNLNVERISVFFHYISELAEKQHLFSAKDEGENIYYFKLKGSYYEISTIIGQGAITFIHTISFDEEKDYVLVDEDVSEEILKERELIQYIIINNDYIGKIDSAKFGVHIGHACTICAIQEHDTDFFQRWYQGGMLQKKIILTANTTKLEALEKEGFYCVRDLGFTEVKNGTLLVVSLGIMSRREAKPFIKRMQLWKDN